MNQRGERHTTTPEILLGAYIATGSGDTQPPGTGNGHLQGLEQVGSFYLSTRPDQRFAQEWRPLNAHCWRATMNVVTTDLPGVLILEPKVFGDERGFFYESFNARAFAEATGLDTQFVQDNH